MRKLYPSSRIVWVLQSAYSLNHNVRGDLKSASARRGHTYFTYTHFSLNQVHKLYHSNFINIFHKRSQTEIPYLISSVREINNSNSISPKS